MEFSEMAYRQEGRVDQLGHRHVNADSYEIIHVLSGEGSVPTALPLPTYTLPSSTVPPFAFSVTVQIAIQCA